jgi:uncharacterized integral membrane protein
MRLAKKLIFIFIIAILAVGVAYFYRVNDNVVDLNLVFHKFEDVTVGSLTVLTFLAGVVFTVALTLIEILVISGREFKLKRQNKKLRKELAKLKKKYEQEDEDEVEEETKMLPEPIEEGVSDTQEKEEE